MKMGNVYTCAGMINANLIYPYPSFHYYLILSNYQHGKTLLLPFTAKQ
jgi:hypothetical protein